MKELAMPSSRKTTLFKACAVNMMSASTSESTNIFRVQGTLLSQALTIYFYLKR